MMKKIVVAAMATILLSAVESQQADAQIFGGRRVLRSNCCPTTPRPRPMILFKNPRGCCPPVYGNAASYPTTAPIVHAPGVADSVIYPAAPMPATPVPAAPAHTNSIEPTPDATTGPAAKKSLYERLGGKPAIEAVVADFVGRTAANPKVNFTRKGTGAEWEASKENVEKLSKHLIQLVSKVTGGPSTYEGRGMEEVHKGMKITNAEFDAMAGDLIATLDKFKVPAAEKEELLKIVGTTRGAIVEE